MAFTERIRRIIKGNNLDIPDGYDFGYNECSHQDHQRDTGYYNDENNGKYVNRPKHWIEHRLAELREIENGLTPDQNKWARNKIWGRMSKDEKDYIKQITNL